MPKGHRRPHVRVAEELLHGADVVPGFEEVRGEGVAERVAGEVTADWRSAPPIPASLARVGSG